jgi:O-antigen/teichoic acid export membrane protein
LTEGKASAKTLIKGTYYTFSSTAVVVLLYALITVLLARYLSPDELGILMTAEAFVELFSFFFKLGFKNSMLRVASNHDKGFQHGLNIAVGNGLLIRLALIVPAGLIVYVSALAVHSNTLLLKAIFCYILIQTFESFANIFGVVRRALNQFKLMAFVNIANRVVRLATIFVILGLLHKDLEFLIYFFTVVTFIRFLFSYFSTVRLCSPQIDTKEIIPMLKESFSYALFDSMEDIQSKVDRVMLNYLSGPVSVAFYSIPAKLNRLTQILPQSINQVFLPSMYKNYAESKDEFTSLNNHVSKFVAVSGILVFVLIYYCSEPVLIKLFGDKYLESVSIVKIFAFINLVWFLNTAPQMVLAAEGDHRKRLVSQFIGVLINISLNALWIARYGIIGAVYATLIASSVQYLLAMYFCRQYIDFRKVFALSFLPAAAVVLMPAYIYIPAYIIYVLLSGLISKDDIKIVWEAFHSKKQ